jgi:hypothetical protein
MKRRLTTRTCLLMLILIVQVGCGGGAPTPNTPPVTEITLTDTPTEVATEATPTDTPTESTPTEQPAERIEPLLKPSLTITDEQGELSSANLTPEHVIGFTFPNGLIAMKAAAITEPFIDEEGTLTVVGVVEINEGAVIIMPGVYSVAIDLTLDAEEVPGQLMHRGGEGEKRDLAFSRTLVVRNEDRQNDPSFPSISPIISSGSLSFVIGFSGGQVTQNPAEVQDWYRYDSLASTDSDTPELILSVRDNFSSEYGDLIGGWESSVNHLNQQGFSQDVDIATDLTISEIEGHKNITSCNDQQECASDITGAPNASFWADYNQARDEAAENNFVVTAAIAKIERTIDIPSQVIIEPGDYWVRLWFDSEENFLGATLLGVTTEDKPVYGQSIPATPAYFLDADDVDNPQKIVSWISAWRAIRWCICQTRC